MATSVWKGHLTFGLVSLPVKLFTAARSETLSFNQLHKHDNSRIKQVIYCQAEDKPIPRDEIVKGYEYEKGKYVVIEDEEIKKVAPKTAKVMEILEFVKAGDVDPVYLESSYYMAPDEGGEKPYALLFEALKDTKYYAVAKIAMHNREHIVVVRPGERGMILHTMYYEDEVRRTEEFRTDTTKVTEREMNLAKMLVESLAAEFEPGKYHDTYRTNLRQMIDAKVEGHKIVETPEPHIAPVIDIMDALKKSLEARKPPKTATASSSSEEESADAVAEQPKRKRAPRKEKTA
jgi:DNA end-binding protein Ku